MKGKLSPDPYPWKTEYELNNELFDEQTRKFLAIINLMKELVGQEAEETDISEVFFRLTHYFERFMIMENIFLRELSYDKLDEHINSHKQFMDRIVAFREGFEKGKKDFHHEMYNYLEEWFDNHIMIDDRKAVDFIGKRRKSKTK